MYWHSILPLFFGFINLRESTELQLCFVKEQNSLKLCKNITMTCPNGVVKQTSAKVYYDTGASKICADKCPVNTPTSFDSNITQHCIGNSECVIASPSHLDKTKGGVINISYTCSDTGPTRDVSPTTNTGPTTNAGPSTNAGISTDTGLTTDAGPSTNAGPTTDAGPTADAGLASSAQVTDNRYTAVIAVSVVVPIMIVISVGSVMLYRTGKCKLLHGKCTNGYDKHSHDRTDEYVMGSIANANPTYIYSLSSDVGGHSCNGAYSEIVKVDKENYCEYNQVNLIKKQPVHDPTYNHIGHFNHSSTDNEQTYDHVGDEVFHKTDSSTLQPDTYSHIGAMSKPGPEQLADDSYAHINDVMNYLPAANEMNQYDSAVFQSNGGQTGNFGHRESEVKSGKQKKFIVVGPSKMDIDNYTPVSYSYFVLEKT